MKWIREGYPARAVLRFVGLSRSTYYHQLRAAGRPRTYGGGRPVPGWTWTLNGGRVADDEVRRYVLDLINGDGLHYGYLKLTHALRRQFGLIVNKKKVYRLCREMDVLRPQRKVRTKHPRKLARNRVITGSNQLWATDVKYGYVPGEDRFFYIASVLDIFDRSVVGCHVGLQCDGKNILQAVTMALRARGQTGRGLVLRSDNGPQFKSKLMNSGCQAIGVEQEYIPCRTPNANAHIESYHSILEAECLEGAYFDSYAEALVQVHKFVQFYNNRRLHSGCGYKPPAEYYMATQAGGVLKQMSVQCPNLRGQAEPAHLTATSWLNVIWM
jgi:putative transposase